MLTLEWNENICSERSIWFAYASLISHLACILHVRRRCSSSISFLSSSGAYMARYPLWEKVRGPRTHAPHDSWIKFALWIIYLLKTSDFGCSEQERTACISHGQKFAHLSCATENGNESTASVCVHVFIHHRAQSTIVSTFHYIRLLSINHMLVCGLACVVCVYALHALTKCAIKINAAGGNSVIRRDKDVRCALMRHGAIEKIEMWNHPSHLRV